MSNIQNAVIELDRLQKENILLGKKIELRKKEIQDYLDKKRLKEFEVVNDDLVIEVKKVERIDINFDIEKLKNVLDKEVLIEIIDKTFTISDLELVKKAFKAAKMSPEQFKSAIEIKEIVNKQKVNKLYEIGDITTEKIKGCYEAKLIKYITLSNKLKKEE